MAAALGGLEGLEDEFRFRLEGGGHFHSMEHRVFYLEQPLTEDQLIGLVASRSYIAILPNEEKEELFDEIRAFARSHPDLQRETFTMPYKTHAYLAVAR